MNQDHNKLFPNQIIDNDPTECVALTVADICGNIDGQLYDPDPIYANALRIENESPNTLGLDPLAGMQAAVVYGNLPISQATFTAKTTSQLYIANWQNYTKDQRTIALQHPQRGIKTLTSYQDIVSHLNKGIGGVALAMKWYSNFMSPDQNGLLPTPKGPNTFHCTAVYENPLIGLQVKPWLGASYAQGGYCYLNQTTFNQVFVGAFAFDPSAWRWFNLASISVTHPWIIPDTLPQMYVGS
jgi:hypothetical protein